MRHPCWWTIWKWRALRKNSPGRPWFRHTVYAARFTYAHLELPGLTEAAEEKDWERAARQAAILSRAVAANTELVVALTRDLPAAPARDR